MPQKYPGGGVGDGVGDGVGGVGGVGGAGDGGFVVFSPVHVVTSKLLKQAWNIACALCLSVSQLALENP